MTWVVQLSTYCDKIHLDRRQEGGHQVWHFITHRQLCPAFVVLGSLPLSLGLFMWGPCPLLLTLWAPTGGPWSELCLAGIQVGTWGSGLRGSECP